VFLGEGKKKKKVIPKQLLSSKKYISENLQNFVQIKDVFPIRVLFKNDRANHQSNKEGLQRPGIANELLTSFPTHAQLQRRDSV